jgi:hypothetical protein
MRRLLPLALVLLAFPACSSSDDDATGTGGGAGTPATGGSGGTGGSAGMATGGMATGGMATGGMATGGASGAGTAGMAATKDAPTDTSVEGITAFLAALDYRSATWAPNAAMPVDSSDLSPHGLVQIWYNQALRQTHAAGKEGSQSPAGTMAVKELYTGSSVVGHAVMLKTDTSWIYYCTASEESRCYPAQTPGQVIYQTNITNCGCHGAGTIASSDQIPPP